jgi:hypothetical protein
MKERDKLYATMNKSLLETWEGIYERMLTYTETDISPRTGKHFTKAEIKNDRENAHKNLALIREELLNKL